MQLPHPPRLSLAQLPTPLHKLQRTSQEVGGGHRIWVKRDDLTGSALSGNKIRKLEFVAAAALEQGCDTLITCGGLQSNHCRATALVGAQLGLNVHLILRGEPDGEPDGNLFLDHLAGAEVSCYAPKQYFRELEALFEHWADHYAARGSKAFCIPTGASDGIGLWGYITGAKELGEDLERNGIARAHLVCATGSGGTQAGLTLGAALHQLPVDVWGVNVCDDEQYFLDKVDADIHDWQQRYGGDQALPEYQTRVIDGYVGPGYGHAGAEIFDCIASLAAREGLLLDPVYTGKAFYGMLQEIEAGRFEGVEDIVFIHTGGIFGLFPQRQQFRLT